MHRFRLTLAVTAAVAIFSATAAGASSGAVASESPTGGTTSALTAKQKQAKRKALKKCGRKATRSGRQACRRNVRRRFAVKPPVEPTIPVEPAVRIDVRDDYFSPDIVNIKSGDSILWVWDELNHDPHNVTLVTGPPGVEREDFETSSSPAVGVTFTRKFTVPGTYYFRCSLHARMSLTVEVS